VKSKAGFVGIGLFIVFMVSSCAQQDDFPVLKGPYLGQKPPGLIPEVFAPGIVSHGNHELRLTISPDNSEMFYVTSDKRWFYIIIHVVKKNKAWTAPEVAFFSGQYSDASPFFSYDGNRLYFCSKRPLPNIDLPNEDFDIWFIERKNDSWSDPLHLDGLINDEKDVWDLSVSKDGTIYFAAGDFLYYSKPIGKDYSKPKELDKRISTGNENSPVIHPDGDYLLFQSSRPRGYGGHDIYVSFRQRNGTWGEPVNLGQPINTESYDFGPRLSPDLKYLFFTSSRPLDSKIFKGKTYTELLELYNHPQNKSGTLFWVNAKIIERFRPKEIK
jgi:Tol biopolymer transport system component